MRAMLRATAMPSRPASASRRPNVGSHSMAMRCPRFGAWRGGDEGGAACEVGLHDAPFEALESADRTAYKQRGMLYAEVFGKQHVATYHVAHGYLREVSVPRFVCRGVDAERPRGPVVRAEEVGADGEVDVGVEKFAPLDRVRPPVGHVRVGRQRVAYPHDIAAVGVHLPECVVGDCHRGQRIAAFEREWVVVCVIQGHSIGL